MTSKCENMIMKSSVTRRWLKDETRQNKSYFTSCN